MRRTLVATCLLAVPTLAQQPPADNESQPQPPTIDKLDASTFSSIRFRSIGPATMSGRISDIAVDPSDHSRWIVATASGGVWITTNAGSTFAPVFDAQGSYSIGACAIDPTNPNVIWIGTGENNSQRSVSFGDGVYKSTDGGKSFSRVGLEDSEHIGRIVIHPRNPDIVYVAAQGPLWRAGGQRGLYKTTDGGKTWNRILHISDDTGINEVHMDPRDPDTLYASSYQRRRTQWTLIDGGPESAIYKSTDAGKTWKKITKGLPAGDLGRIGLSISPADPDIVYAIVTATEDNSGFYRSTNRGETWQRMSAYKTDSPQYYNEIWADPHDPDRCYIGNTFLMVTDDGGRTIRRAGESRKHVDNHALWIDPDDPDHLIAGCDGGIYETFDRCRNWKYFPNLPLTQFYRVAVDNAEPFYNIYGGTQDNNTLGGPSATINSAGIVNADWFITVGGDGFEPAVDPEDPNIVYSQWQYGNLVRHDRRSGETLDIKPQPTPDDPPFVFNWDSPLIISPHSHTRLYFAGRYLFRSDDRGNSWTRISDDLSRGLDRNTLEVMGRIQPPEAVDKDLYTSIWGTCVSLSESPLVEDLIYTGTDDGLIRVTPDAGDTWNTIEVFPGVPYMTYVSDIEASRHDPDTVYASFDNHKAGDFTPYILRSTDRGKTWTSIRGDLPDRNIVYTICEDTEDPDLLFVGTEFGAYWTRNGGKNWHKLAGLPTIAVRDLEIQRRENDLVAATFGRGFYILDDYTPIRLANDDILAKDAYIFPVRDARLYIPAGYNSPWNQGAQFYTAPNPAYGATFTIHVKDVPQTKKAQRKKQKLTAENYPSIDQLREEDRERSPEMFLTIRDADGETVRRLSIGASSGLRRVTWDLRYASPQGQGAGPYAPPATYTAQLSLVHEGEIRELGEPREFRVVALDLASFPSRDPQAKLEFQQQAGALYRRVAAAQSFMGELTRRHDALRRIILATPEADQSLLADLEDIRDRLHAVGLALNGDPSASRRMVPTPPSISQRISTALFGTYSVSSDPTQTQRDQVAFAAELFEPQRAELQAIDEAITAIEQKMDEIGAPWTPGRKPVTDAP